MSDPSQVPEPAVPETPTVPLPPMTDAEVAEQTAAAEYAVPPGDVPPGAGYAPPPPPHHRLHRASNGAIIAMVVGTLLFGAFAFALGWMGRGFVDRARMGTFSSRGFYGRGMMGGQGYGRGMMRGPGYGQGFGQGPGGGQGYGYGQGPGGGYGYPHGYGQGAPDGSAVPSATIPTPPSGAPVQ